MNQKTSNYDSEEELGAYIYRSSVSARVRANNAKEKSRSVIGKGKTPDPEHDAPSKKKKQASGGDAATKKRVCPARAAKRSQALVVKDVDQPVKKKSKSHQTSSSRRCKKYPQAGYGGTESDNVPPPVRKQKRCSKEGCTNGGFKRYQGMCRGHFNEINIGQMRDTSWSDKNWKKHLENLRAYKESHGHTCVPKGDRSLGSWVREQRKHYHRKLRGERTTMTDERVICLNELGFVWIVQRWEKKLEELRLYKERHGHTNVSQTEGRLGQWVREQRQHYKKKLRGEHTAITDERIHKLNELGFHWAVKPGRIWRKYLEDLRLYKESHGHTNISEGSLGMWVKEQRLCYQRKLKGEQNPLTDEQVKYLNDLGFVWRLKPDRAGKGECKEIKVEKKRSTSYNDKKWKKKLEELRIYKERNGHTNVPYNKGSLGQWVSEQRQYYRRKLEGDRINIITDERVNALNELGFVWRLLPREEDKQEFIWSETAKKRVCSWYPFCKSKASECGGVHRTLCSKYGENGTHSHDAPSEDNLKKAKRAVKTQQQRERRTRKKKC